MSHFKANVYTSCTINHSRKFLQSLFRSLLAAFCPRSRLVPRDPALVVPRPCRCSRQKRVPEDCRLEAHGHTPDRCRTSGVQLQSPRLQRRPKVQLRHGFTSCFSGYHGGGRASLASCVRPLGDGDQCRQDIAELPDARLTKRKVDPVI
jgi:hypothetical protein